MLSSRLYHHVIQDRTWICKAQLDKAKIKRPDAAYTSNEEEIEEMVTAKSETASEFLFFLFAD